MRVSRSAPCLIAVVVGLVFGAGSGMTAAQVHIEVLPMPRHPFPHFGLSRQTMPVGISRDGRTISGNGFSSRGSIFEFNSPIAWQFDRATGVFTYPGEEINQSTGLRFAPNHSMLYTVNATGSAGVMSLELPYLWRRGEGHVRTFDGSGSIEQLSDD